MGLNSQRKRLGRLSRYTSLPVLFDMLKRQKLVLLDPASWEDKNDSEILLEYKRKRKLRALYVLCLSQGDETIHHWKTFSDGISGCSIGFDPTKLISLLKKLDGVRFGRVVYRKIQDLDDRAIAVRNMPFTKRWPYRCEQEFRIIWDGQTNAPGYGIAFDLRMIRKITISQRMPNRVYSTIREYLEGAFADPSLRINRSTLYQNRIWINKFKSP